MKRAKTSGEPDKSLRASHRERSEKQAGKVKATERRLARLPTVDKPWEGWRLELSLAATGRSGDVVVRLDQAVIQRGGPGPGSASGGGVGPGDETAGFRLGPIDLEVTWQDRVAILGPNGSGKSTLLAALLGQVPLASGRRWIGPGVRVGEMDQARARFGGEPSVLATFQALTDLPLSESRSLLAKFGLGPDHLVRAGHDLSPGERSRAQLGALMATGVNCLVLDEPTNHLDIEAIEQLESALTAFDGTLLLVSHDRRFLDTVDLTRTIEL